MTMPYEVLGRRIVFDNPFQTVYLEKVRLKSGRTYDYVINAGRNWVMIVPFVSEDKVVLVRQYRHGVRRMVTGLCSGFQEKGESAIDTAKRELAEELSMTASRFKVAARIYLNPSREDTVGTLVFAYGVRKSGARPNADEAEGAVEPMIVSIPKLISSPSIIQNGSMLAGLPFIISDYLGKSISRRKASRYNKA